ncbi:MAG TPA: methyltransferase domain-containing protein [Planctomycetota bacterium]|nr:methyltransferase domain-containing protein [Planctomycetota bacterium]HRR78835.1 methyltransferase domain-containing protein [Planctomycetota bacterium]HRT92859.1 methyltransferase domain-containing protein [Planctomycetota bacterium]
MEFLDLLRCPACRGALRAGPQALDCPACSRRFEVVHGIPDFRPDSPGAPRHGEFCREVIARWPRTSYRDLWQFYHGDECDALGRLWDRHEAEAPRRGERRWDTIVRHAAAAGRAVGAGGTALDIGCGVGSALFGLARRCALAVGIDILLTDLLLAKKRFAEAGTGNVAFVCGSALELPLADSCFDLLNATDVIEHVQEPARLLAEARRVMRPGAVLFFNSPNRFSLLTREPHVKLWGVGWLPRRWMEPYVRWRRGRSYRGKHLLSLAELRALMRAAFGRSFAIRALLPRSRAARALCWPMEVLARPLLPQHNVTAWAVDEAGEKREGA